jgi:ribosomal protein S18 acetylase RimI-like enzyme
LTPGVEVRRARPDEIAACADLYLKVLTDTFTWMAPERHSRADFIQAASSEEVYVAVEGGRILGLATLYRPQTFIHSLYVTERGRGIGKALLDHLDPEAGGTLSLKVQAANLRAQRFYEREGFVCVERGRDAGSDIDWLRLVRVRTKS